LEWVGRHDPERPFTPVARLSGVSRRKHLLDEVPTIGMWAMHAPTVGPQRRVGEPSHRFPVSLRGGSATAETATLLVPELLEAKSSLSADGIREAFAG
jgi:hypothetical protein